MGPLRRILTSPSLSETYFDASSVEQASCIDAAGIRVSQISGNMEYFTLLQSTVSPRERERERESQLVNEEGSNLRAEAFFGDLHRTADEDLVGIIPRL